LYSYEEFAEQWKGSKHSFVVFINSRNLPRLENLLAAPAKPLIEVGDTAVVKFN
jgi:hypothetical protein